jgi:rhamnopyranosyl-N-acetylglucosaminyl-diphospho-decaprenol beta-1,3/1,4-galactofuranosyltransferase
VTRVVAIVPTYDSRGKLVNSLSAVADQTRPPDALIIVDNASPDGVIRAAKMSAVTVPLGVVRLPRNTGIAGGFGVGVASAVAEDADWVWLLDDDTVPDPDCLAVLLRAAAAHPGASVVAPRVVDVRGIVQGHHRGYYRWRHTFPVSVGRYHEDLVPVGYVSYAGILVRGSAARQTGGPDQRWFLMADDLEWSLRLGEIGPLYLCPNARIVHDDGHVGRPPGLMAAIRNHFAISPNAASHVWHYILTFRNASWMRRQRDHEGWVGWFVNYLLQAIRVLVMGEHRRQSLRLYRWYGLAGRRGNFNHIELAAWAQALGDRRQTHRLHPDRSPEATPWSPLPEPLIRWLNVAPLSIDSPF